jgi:trk system potassium uptake protein TrkA
VVEFLIAEGSSSAGVDLAHLPLPRECVVVSVVRNGSIIIPHGDTILQVNDQVTVLRGGCSIMDLQPFFQVDPGSEPDASKA